MNDIETIELVLTYKHSPEDTEIFTERVSAVKVREYYKLTQVPAFAPNIAYGDIVKVEFDEGEYHFEELIEESGFSVARIVIWRPEAKQHIIAILEEFGCGLNTHLADNFIVLSIPPGISYKPIRAILLKEESAKNIDFGECLSKIHADSIQ